MNKEGYLRKDVATITGVKFATVQQYTERRLITASIDNPSGRGTNRRYSTGDMVELLVCRKLVELGVKHKDISKIMDILRNLKIGGISPVRDYRENIGFYVVIMNHGTEKMSIQGSVLNLDHNSNFEIMGTDFENVIIINTGDILKKIKLNT